MSKQKNKLAKSKKNERFKIHKTLGNEKTEKSLLSKYLELARMKKQESFLRRRHQRIVGHYCSETEIIIVCGHATEIFEDDSCVLCDIGKRKISPSPFSNLFVRFCAIEVLSCQTNSLRPDALLPQIQNCWILTKCDDILFSRQS